MKKKPLANIFASKKQKENPASCPNPHHPIIIDTREKQSLIAANLLEQKANIKFEKLDIGDYLINDICIERKTFADFLSSMINKRLLMQLREIKKYPKPILLIEGFYYDYDQHTVHENAIRGMLTSIATEFQVPIIYTEDEKDTAKFIINLARKPEKPKQPLSTRPTKTFETLEERKQFILEGFPKIGPTTAKKLLEKHKKLRKIFNLKDEELKEFMDDKTINRWSELLEN
jgi:ERCC4-type nuclease